MGVRFVYLPPEFEVFKSGMDIKMIESLESSLARVKFSVARPGADRIHYIDADAVRTVLSRLPLELWQRLRAVHLNDRGRARILGYVTRGRREIALCALPPRLSLTAALVKGQTPEHFRARRGEKWPRLAVRRFMLYNVLLHELGHLQLVDNTRSARLKFAREKLAQNFALRWSNWLWTAQFVHSDPVHNPPCPDELPVNESEADYRPCVSKA
jgi:hypothetical protein